MQRDSNLRRPDPSAPHAAEGDDVDEDDEEMPPQDCKRLREYKGFDCEIGISRFSDCDLRIRTFIQGSITARKIGPQGIWMSMIDKFRKSGFSNQEFPTLTQIQ